MNTLIEQLTESFTHALHIAFPTLTESVFAEITQSTQEHFGHYQCNSALKLAKQLGQAPLAIAEKIISTLETLPIHDAIQCEVAKPGFINIRFQPAFLAAQCQHMLTEKHFGIPTNHQNQKIIIDFSSPNVAKEMHVGHLRSTIIGDCLARIFEFLGFTTLRLNHIGDWGTAFGMLITHLFEVAQPILNGDQKTNVTQLLNWYRESKKRFDEDPEFKKASQLAVVALQKEDPKFIHAWEIICAISRESNQEIYDLLDIKLIERGESFYNPFLKSIIEDLEKKGLLENSEGAKCIFLEGFKNRQGEFLPFIIQKSDGGYNYATTDLAAIWHRITFEKTDRIIYVTDAGQITHFQMLFKVAEKAGYLDPHQVECNHVPFGLVLGPDGKKFKTRSGQTERLIDLLMAAVNKAKTILKERDPHLSGRDLEEKAQIFGINAVKYADLSCNRTNDYVFSYDRMLQFEGNTATFLMYSYVRILGIQRKVGLPIEEVLKNNSISLEHPSEIQLALHLNRFNETLKLIERNLLPHHLTDYAYQLAEYFNAFFRDCRVEGSTQQNARLLLCELTAHVLKQSLTLLGLKIVNKM
jgi:arginyl-tRNA synthetase